MNVEITFARRSVRVPARRRVARALAAGLFASALLGAPLASHGGPSDEPPIMVVDLHVDLPWQVHFKGRKLDLAEGHARISALRAGGYGGIVFPIYLPDKAHADGAHIADADAVFATIATIIAQHPDVFLPLGSARAEPGKITTFLAIEGGGAFAADVTAIDRFIDRGLRLVSPVHQHNSGLASSATDKKTGHGLTAVGTAFCARVYEHGALIDVSHVSDEAFADIATIAEEHHAPIVATHSNARAVADHPRNLTDAQLRRIAASGGVAGLNLHAPFVSGGADASIDDVVKQVDHMVRIAGIAHVAIGSDFDGGIHPPTGLDDASMLPKLAAALRRRGRSYDDVLAIFSLNALRVLGWRPPPVFPADADADRDGRTHSSRTTLPPPERIPAMTELTDRCLDTFPEWLRALATDASQLAQVLAAPDASETTRRYIAGGLNYLFKSLDLIPDGIEDLGFLDDAFVLRVAASLALTDAPALRESSPTLVRLADGVKLIAEVLGKDYARLERYVQTLTRAAARGRSVDEILNDEHVRAAFLLEVTGWAASYETPTFSRDEKNIVKLQSFLGAKLPA